MHSTGERRKLSVELSEVTDDLLLQKDEDQGAEKKASAELAK